MNYSPQPSSNTAAAVCWVAAAAQLMIPIMSVILFGSIMMQRVAEYTRCEKQQLLPLPAELLAVTPHWRPAASINVHVGNNGPTYQGSSHLVS